MYIRVKYGKNEELICNPMCAVVNLLSSIKKRTGYHNQNIRLDLSDETGDVRTTSNDVMKTNAFCMC